MFCVPVFCLHPLDFKGLVVLSGVPGVLLLPSSLLSTRTQEDPKAQGGTVSPCPGAEALQPLGQDSGGGLVERSAATNFTADAPSGRHAQLCASGLRAQETHTRLVKGGPGPHAGCWPH